MGIQDIQKKRLPDTPGVYFFLGKKIPYGGKKGREILYIGKAGSLHNRVRSYFGKQLEDSRSPAISHMVKNAHELTFTTTDSVLEALILEAALIKKHQPKYNVREKDDKSFKYIVITDEDFPKVLIMRERDLLKQKSSLKFRHIYGPFPQGGVLKDALSIIRKIFPFRDTTCIPVSEVPSNKKQSPCFSYHIGLCPGVCVGAIGKSAYKERIRNIELFFSGKKKTLIKKLERHMKRAAKEHKFERAGELKKTLFSLRHIQDVALLRGHEELQEESVSKFRVEAYDVAHLRGTHSVGVMVVVEGGRAKKSDYRKFKIKEADNSDDVGALAEVLRRRLTHTNWRMPDLIVVDGGVAQKRRAEKTLRDSSFSIPVVAVVKDERHRPRELRGNSIFTKPYEREILLANHEAHRFAIAYHRGAREKGFISSKNTSRRDVK